MTQSSQMYPNAMALTLASFFLGGAVTVIATVVIVGGIIRNDASQLNASTIQELSHILPTANLNGASNSTNTASTNSSTCS